MNKPLSFEERVEIEKHIKNDLSCIQIAKIIGRSASAMSLQIRIAGGRDKYCAQKEQIKADERIKQKNLNISKGSILNRRKFSISDEKRITNLEFQVEILHDIIKELKND